MGKESFLHNLKQILRAIRTPIKMILTKSNQSLPFAVVRSSKNLFLNIMKRKLLRVKEGLMNLYLLPIIMI